MNGDWRRGGDGADTGIFRWCEEATRAKMRGGRRRRSTSGFGLISATRLLTAAKICPRGLTQPFFNYRLIRYTPTRSKIVEDRNRRGMLNQRLEDKPGTVSSINLQVENKIYFWKKGFASHDRYETQPFAFASSLSPYFSFCCPYHNSPSPSRFQQFQRLETQTSPFTKFVPSVDLQIILDVFLT